MSIKVKRIMFIVLEIVGIVWNILCIKNFIPLRYYSASVVWIFGFLMIMMFLLPDKRDEKSKHISKLSSAERTLGIITLIFGAAWLITIIACMVY